jgi:hypothetical protein
MTSRRHLRHRDLMWGSRKKAGYATPGVGQIGKPAAGDKPMPPPLQPPGRIMWDSTTPAAIPSDAELVAGYVNGRYAWSPLDWARWAPARRVSITVLASELGAQVLDVETGDATPAQARAWVEGRHLAGVVAPICYSNRGEGMHLALTLVGLRWRWWCADWTGIPHTVLGAAAVQYAAPGIGTALHVDLSWVTDPTFPA